MLESLTLLLWATPSSLITTVMAFKDAGDAGVANVVVNLLDGSGNPVLDDTGVAVSTTTDANGNYSFDELQPGDFQVQFVAPTGNDFTLQNVGRRRFG